MKKTLMASVACLAAACLFAGCSLLPGYGKMEIIASPTPTDAPAASADTEEQTPRQQDLTQEQIEELIEEGIVPEDVEQGEGSITFYDNDKVQDALQKYDDKMECSTAMLGGSRMVVQVTNHNDITIPKVVVSIYSADTEAEEDREYYQVLPGGQIVIPIEKESGELPPPVAAGATVSLNKNEYVNIADQLGFSAQETETSLDLSVVNNAQAPCRILSVTAKFFADSGMVFAQAQRLEGELAPGGSGQLAFSLPDDLVEAGVSCTSIEYVVNQAVA